MIKLRKLSKIANGTLEDAMQKDGIFCPLQNHPDASGVCATNCAFYSESDNGMIYCKDYCIGQLE